MNYQNILNEINKLKALKKKLLNVNNKYANDQCSILDQKINDLEKQIYSSDIDKFEDNYDELLNNNFTKKKNISKLIEENHNLDLQINELYIINKNKLIELDNIKNIFEKTKKELENVIINNNQLLLKIEEEKSKVFSNFNIIDIKNKEIDKLKSLIIDQEMYKFNYLEKFNTYFEINNKLHNEIEILKIQLEEYKNNFNKYRLKNKELINQKKYLYFESLKLTEEKNLLLNDTKNILNNLGYQENKFNRLQEIIENLYNNNIELLQDNYILNYLKIDKIKEEIKIKTKKNKHNNEIDIINQKLIDIYNKIENKNNFIKDEIEIININIKNKYKDIYDDYLKNQEKYIELNLLYSKCNNLENEYNQIILLNEHYENKIKEYLNSNLSEKITENELLIHEVIKIKEKNKLFFEKIEKSINKIKTIDNKINNCIKTLENRFNINTMYINTPFINYIEKLITDNTIINIINVQNICDIYIPNDYTLLYMLNNYGYNAILFNDYIRNIKNKSNGITIDIDFYKNANDINIQNINIYQHILNYGVIDGYLYSSKQFYKIFPENKLIYNHLLYVQDPNLSTLIPIRDYLKENLYNKDFDYFINKFQILEMSINNNDLSLFVFIGYRDRGLDLINKINNYYINQDYNLIVILNNKDNYDLIDKINCKNRIVYLTNDYGNDIIPTLITFNDINKKIQLNYIIKLQTKYNPHFFNNVINYLLEKKLYVLIKLLSDSKMNTIGHPNYIGTIETDKFYNSLLIVKYQNYININKNFIGGTMFFCHKITFDKIIDFIKNNNFKSYFINNLYDTNSVNKLASPIHFIERLFGLIK
jgi:hypothetical protein